MDISVLKKTIGNWLFVLFILILTVDPTGSILHLKNIVFILLVAYNMVCFRPDFSKIPLILALFSVVILSWLSGTIQEVDIDMKQTLAVLKSVSPAVLLLWVREYDLISLARFPIVFTSLFVVILFWIIMLVPETEGFIYYFFNTESDDTIMMAWRSFLGFEVFGMYYKSIVSFILVFAVYLSAFFNKKHRNLGVILCTLIILHAFAISGTRSTMLLPFFLIVVIGYREFKDMRYFKYILYPMIFFLAILFVVVLFMFIMEKDETSNTIKYAHLYSYWKLFSEHPLYLLIGQGAGSAFYSSGFHRMSYDTEWTYLELLRYFGVFSLVVIYAFYRPLLTMWKDRSVNLSYTLFWSYLAYLMIAGTNPLMLSSTGMLVLLMVYSYEAKLKKNAV